MMTAPNPIADTSTAADLRCALARALPPAAGGRIRAGRSASAPGAPRTPCRPDSSTRPASPPPPSSATPRSPPPSSPPGQCLPQRAVVVPPRAVDSPSHSAAPSTCPAARKRWSTTPVCGRPRRRRLADGRLSRSGWHGSASDRSSSATATIATSHVEERKADRALERCSLDAKRQTENEGGADLEVDLALVVAEPAVVGEHVDARGRHLHLLELRRRRLHHRVLDLAYADHPLAGGLHLSPSHVASVQGPHHPPTQGRLAQSCRHAADEWHRCSMEQALEAGLVWTLFQVMRMHATLRCS
mmetsp:Transcript_35573/g.71256  ORF Transcript_35573/g.71256 Transcript_35573/m.71256 type:complete len:301 (-) Transcript_35573:1795-2697(-)